MAKLEFQGQQEGEEVLLVFRRHPSVMSKDIILALLVLAVSTIPTLVWRDYVWAFWFPLAGMLVAAFITLKVWVQWYFTIYIVTGDRIRQQIQQGLFNKTANDLYLNKVQNISYNISGLFGSMLGYGTIVLQTMFGDMIVTKVADCERVYNQLSKIIKTAGGEINQGEYGHKEEDSN